MPRISKTRDLDIKELENFYSKYVIITNVNYISKLRIRRNSILEKYNLYNSRQTEHYANIIPKLKNKKHATMTSIYAIS